MISLIEIYNNILKEEAYNSTATKYAVNKILSGNYDFKLKLQTKPNRIGNLDKITSDDFISKVILPNFKIKKSDIKIIPPGKSPNTKKDSPEGSTKYNMYEFPTEKGHARIILSGGANEGQKYEENFISRLKSNVGKSISDIEDKEVKQLFSDLKIDPKQLKQDDISSTGATNTNRTPSITGPENIGKVIADITINYKNKPYYISLKNVSGGILYNGPVIPFIVQDKNSEKVSFDKSKYSNNKIVKDLFDLFKIDPKKIVGGLNSYINKTPGNKKVSDITNNVDLEKVSNLLSSSLGFGYYYVRQTKNGLKIIPILNEKQSRNFIGNIENVILEYPYSESKTVRIIINANSPVLGQTRFLIDMRNAKGGLVPIRFNVSAFYKK